MKQLFIVGFNQQAEGADDDDEDEDENFNPTDSDSGSESSGSEDDDESDWDEDEDDSGMIPCVIENSCSAVRTCSDIMRCEVKQS